MEFLEKLNDRQREAAETLTGPLLIVAGAGSGKTRTLTCRIANLIANGMAQPWQILAVTFTNKAAAEMKARVQLLIEKTFGSFDEDNQPMIGTFHSICVRILRRNFDRFNRNKSFVIYDATDTKGLIKRIIKEQDIDDAKIKPALVLGMISNAKNKLMNAEEYKKGARGYVDGVVARLYVEYEKRLISNNAVDFDDLIMYTVKLFKENPDVLDYYQERWKYINVDEYQDTNHAQYILAKLLSDKYRNICVIGDSDQSIYSFRGADISNILDFEKDYADAKIIKLEQNYRSTQAILDAADAVISQNKNRPEKKMWTDQKEGDLIDVWHCRSEYEESEKIAKEIEDLMNKKSVQLNDVIILYRTNAQSRILEEMLLRYGFPYKVIGGVKFYARKEIKDLLAYLRIILNQSDTDSLLRIINTPSRRIGATTINKLHGFAMSRSLTLSEVLNHVEMVDTLSDRNKQALSNFWKMVLIWKEKAKTLPVSDLMKLIVEDIGYKKFLLDGTEEGEMRYENILELISVAGKYSHLDPEVSLPSFLEEVALVADTDQIEDGSGSVTLMTLHSVKGLEYPYVFIAGCEESIFPHARSLMDNSQMEEERRLMYVGVTRAMKKLYLVAAKQRMIFGDYQRNRLSRFIQDIPRHLINGNLKTESANTYSHPQSHAVDEKIEQPKIAEDRFQDGDNVLHKRYGVGVVVETRGDIVTVAFKDIVYGIKKFAANVAPLEKVSE